MELEIASCWVVKDEWVAFFKILVTGFKNIYKHPTNAVFIKA
jgi:hypothetical protein